MKTKLKPQATEKDFGRDLATFERLPERTKELLKLKEQSEKATGPKQIVITRRIEKKARKSRP
jgi:hypothetical protein